MQSPPSYSTALRRRTVATLFGGVALGSLGFIPAFAVVTLLARELTGSAALSGLPVALAVLGTAAGAWLLSGVMAHRGRRPGLVLGFVVGGVGAGAWLTAALTDQFVWLLVGGLPIGFANASIQLSRYAAADMYPPAQRGSAVGVVVWGATAGAVIGPALIDPTSRLGIALGLDALAGPFLLALAAIGLVGVLSWALLRPDPRDLALPDPPVTSDVSGEAVGFPAAQLAVALAALAGAQVVMVSVMTMTPLHVEDAGRGLGFIGLVMSAHMVGMFALAPLSGRLTDRFGSLAVILSGTSLLAASVVMAGFVPAGGPLIMVALFGIGFGWNLCFVAGSALLTHGLPLAARARLQGRTDAIVWSTSALASTGSGVVVWLVGYEALAVVAAALTAFPAAVALSQRRHLRAVQPVS